MTAEIDIFDQKIINVLASQGRISVTALANIIGLSKSPTQARLKRLEEGGVIRGYRAMFDPIQLGKDHVAFAEIRLEKASEQNFDQFNKDIDAIPEVEECHLIAGSFDYLLKVRTKDMNAYRALLARRLSVLPNVAHVTSHIAMQSVKDSDMATRAVLPCKA